MSGSVPGCVAVMDGGDTGTGRKVTKAGIGELRLLRASLPHVLCPPVSHSCVPRDTLRGKAGVIPALGVLKLQGKAALSSFPKFCSLPSLDQINPPKDGSGEGRVAGGGLGTDVPWLCMEYTD